jgi:hypothetical protein
VKTEKSAATLGRKEFLPDVGLTISVACPE